MHFHIIHNPVAGNGKSNKALKKISEYLDERKLSFTEHHTLHVGHATKITEKLTSNDEEVHILCLGGDGTLSEIVNGIVNFEKTFLGLIPCGSGNDFATNFSGLNKKNIIGSLETILNSKARKIDFLQINNKRCINVLGFGIDLDVALIYQKLKGFSPKINYRIALVIGIFFFKWHKAKIRVDDGEERFIKTALFTAGNGKKFGSGIPATKHAEVDDNLIDYFVIHKFPRWMVIWVLLRVLIGNGEKIKCAEYKKCKKIEIKFGRKEYEIDGEIHSDTDKIEITIGKEKINWLS